MNWGKSLVKAFFIIILFRLFDFSKQVRQIQIRTGKVNMARPKPRIIQFTHPNIVLNHPYLVIIHYCPPAESRFNILITKLVCAMCQLDQPVRRIVILDISCYPARSFHATAKPVGHTFIPYFIHGAYFLGIWNILDGIVANFYVKHFLVK